MDSRKRQLLGYLAAGVVVLTVTFGAGAGYATGYYSVAGRDAIAPPRPLPKNVCTLLPKSTQLRLVPSATALAHDVRERGTEQITARCGLTTNSRAALTYNKARLTVQVHRFGAETPRARVEAAERAMVRAEKRTGDAGSTERGLGDRSLVTIDEPESHQWKVTVLAQHADTMVELEYSTWLSDGTDTRSAAVVATQQLLAGLS